jgi:hypothetical protein
MSNLRSIFDDDDEGSDNDSNKRRGVPKMRRPSANKRRYHPTRNEAIEITKEGKLTTYVDDDGRLYGFSDKNDLVEGAEESGDVNNISTFFMWICLPSARKGHHIDSGNDEDHVRGESLLVGEDLVFPEPGDYVRLTNRRTGQKLEEMKVLYYPERRRSNAKSDSVVLIMDS